MDMMLLVVDATKGMQAQTTECVVIGEAVMASGADVIVVLNKVCTGQPCTTRGGRFVRVLLAALRKHQGCLLHPQEYVMCLVKHGATFRARVVDTLPGTPLDYLGLFGAAPSDTG